MAYSSKGRGTWTSRTLSGAPVQSSGLCDIPNYAHKESLLAIVSETLNAKI
jgi:hypothetical protein